MVRPIRRIVAGNDDRGKAVVLSDAPSPDVVLDPARPGFASTRLWVTDASPARVKGIRETLTGPQRLAPPAHGTQCRFVEYPPERGTIDQFRPDDVRAWFARIGAPEAARPGGAHPYMQRTGTVDLCYVLEGDIVLVLDSGEVALSAGDVAIINGASHAWSNRSDAPAIVILSQHAGVDEAALPPPASPSGIIPAPPKPIRDKFRRVVIGHDGANRSCVIQDGGTPNIFQRPTGTWFYEVWTVDDMPAPLLGNIDRGGAGRTVMHSPPPAGANWRISYSPPDVAPVHVSTPTDARAVAMDTGGGTERRPGSSGMHRTPSVDYAICLEGDRTLVLEDSEVVLNKGDVVIQLGNWHTWAKHSEGPNMMSYVMIGGEFG
ncbi:MAG: cupin domain-containing protein [Hyphomicrobiales bacterium]|nr:cupin domain-containing protein [Hyphomicrobiales bacterium]